MYLELRGHVYSLAGSCHYDDHSFWWHWSQSLVVYILEVVEGCAQTADICSSVGCQFPISNPMLLCAHLYGQDSNLRVNKADDLILPIRRGPAGYPWDPVELMVCVCVCVVSDVLYVVIIYVCEITREERGRS